jgi:uncharacterized membrane protein
MVTVPEDPAEGAEAAELSAHRLEAFSDGVMAVIITLMAFEIKAPSSFHLVDLRHEVPSLLVYVLSFTFIGIYWNNHHHLLRVTPRITAGVMWANLAVLFWLSLVPFLTEWVAIQYRHPLPAASYGVGALGAAIAYWVLVRTITRANADAHVARAIGTDVKGMISPVLYLTGIGLAFVEPWLAYGVYVLVALIWFIPDRRLVR